MRPAINKSAAAPVVAGIVLLLAGRRSSAPEAGPVAPPLATSAAPGAVGSRASDPSGTLDSFVRFALPTSDWTPGSFSMLAGMQGELVTDEHGCLQIQALGSRGARGVDVVWPKGYSARRTGKAIELLDPKGFVIARVGQLIDTAGGFGGDTAGDPPGCAGAYPWYVQSEIRLFTDPDSVVALPSDATPTRTRGPR